ncbi:polyprenyl diphosphate synthase [Dehalogenimonas sp. THU2]|uniref:polyprenyl diphosphate synthase n=1 Tax=Dehalogenimonas sp. THU2 TaxID=3151121 RepID=UPI0032181BD6
MSETQGASAALPQHVAIIMDGNGRWAVGQGLPRMEGHRAGLKNVSKAVRALVELGVPYVTLFSFSTENWKRPEDEIAGLLRLLAEALDDTAKELHRQDIVIRHLGRLDRLPISLRLGIGRIVEQTKGNKGAVASFAFDYGGRTEIIEATRKAVESGIRPGKIDETIFEGFLNTTGLPDVDLLVRTGGEKRLSNFLLWQSAYAELYFTDTLWPDFGRAEIEKALADYARRQRRFGGL